MSFNPLQIVVFDRALAAQVLGEELARRGHDVLFLERGLSDLDARYGKDVHEADFVMVGSALPDSQELGRWVTKTARGVTAFYDRDTPRTLALQEQGRSGALISAYDLYLSSSGGPALRTLTERCGAQRVLPFYNFVDPELSFAQPPLPRWDLGYVGDFRSECQLSLNRLLLEPARRWPSGRFVVAGAPYPAGIAWPQNVVRNEHLPSARQRAFYMTQRFALNLTPPERLETGYSPSAQLLEAAAAGTPMISDYWDGLETFFGLGSEILIAYSPEIVLQCLVEMPERERQALGAAARARVLAEHTTAHRAAQLETAVQKALAEKKSAS